MHRFICEICHIILPKSFNRIREQFPEVAEAYDALGFPTAVSGFSWINDVLDDSQA